MVQAGDLIADIKTDKATMEFETTEGGRVAQLVIAEGTDDVAVGSVIALLAGADDTAPEPPMAERTLAAPPEMSARAPVPASRLETVRSQSKL